MVALYTRVAGDFLVGGTDSKKIYAPARVRREVRGKWTEKNRRDTEETVIPRFTREVFPMRKKIVFFSLVTLLALLPLFTRYAAAKPFYQGRIITLIVSTNPGGGFDTYGRLLARTMTKYLPGSTIIVKNIPGAGHIVGVNQLYASKPDGLTFGIFSRALIASQAAGVKGIKFDLTKMSWLGSCASDPRALVVSKHTPYKTVDDVVKSKEKVTFAAHGVGSMDYIDPLLVERMLGAKTWKIVTGYAGGEGELAMMRGEIHGEFMSWSQAKRMVEAGEARVVMFNADEPMKGYEDVPLLSNLVGEEYKTLMDLLLFLVVFNRPFAGPPDIPADRIQILREAFKKSWHDPELLKQAEKLDVPIYYIGHE